MAKKRGFTVAGLFKTLGAILGFFITAMIFVFVGLIFINVLNLVFSEPVVFDGNVALIPVKGTISTTGSTGDVLSRGGIKSETVVKWIQEAEKDDGIKAIFFDIDSPGGTPVGSVEIAEAVKRAEKPTVAVIHEMGTSGAYWVASATDKIFANRLSTIGSIGVKSSYLEFAGLMDDYNVTYRRLIAGKYKDIMSPYKEMTIEEQKKVQERLDKLHEIFINAVAQNRGLDVEHVYDIADGYIYFGDEAKELGLIDFIGTTEDAKKMIGKELNITVEFRKFKEKKGFFEIFTDVMYDSSYNIGQGIGSVWLSSTEDSGPELFV
ncbi:signal peptide peptidase SppA [Candidatus Woesearchaeota archaeon]|nr:signal peptide peptidase SppA [Candidatus Woesearchaeota archaeon]MBW3005258.1 signal peptide peptidase SppA [Candidatus Woesearchaeota archaeon]